MLNFVVEDQALQCVSRPDMFSFPIFVTKKGLKLQSRAFFSQNLALAAVLSTF